MLNVAIVLEIEDFALRRGHAQVPVSNGAQRVLFAQVSAVPRVGAVLTHDLAGICQQIAAIRQIGEAK